MNQFLTILALSFICAFSWASPHTLLTGSKFGQNHAEQLLKAKEFDSNKPILLTPKLTEFAITLKSNPSTGYHWFVTKLPAGIKALSYRYNPATSQLVGAPGHSVWTFSIADPTLFYVPRALDIKFVYMRPWDKDNMQVKIVKVFTTRA